MPAWPTRRSRGWPACRRRTPIQGRSRQIARVIDLPFGKRPFRVHIDPAEDGAEVVNAVADRMRREMYRDIGLADLLSPHMAG